MTTGWKCPSCGHCFAPAMMECNNCNTVSQRSHTATGNVFIPNKDCKCKPDKNESCGKCEILEKQVLQLICD